MRWIKRLKWIRASKIIIPIALAISLVFAGFSVYAKEAEYFVLRVNNGDGVSLALAMNRDLSDATPRLLVPVNGGYDNVTWTPDSNRTYKHNKYSRDLPDDIAQHDGEHSVYETKGRYSFYSFSFWLINKSTRAVDVDMRMDIDSITVGKNDKDVHIDEAIRVMVIEGDPGPRLSDETYMIYKKAEKTEEAEKELTERLRKVDGYDNNKTIAFESDLCIFNREGELGGYRNFASGETIRFTIVVWLEGWDSECIDPIIGEKLKMSISFTGH